MNTLRPLAIALALALSACGGGGGGGGGVATLPLGPLSVSNQNVAAQDSMSASNASLGSTATLTGAQVVDSSAVFQAARAELGKFDAYLTAIKAGATLSGASASTRVACSTGYMDVSGTDADNSNSVTAGDSVTINAVACKVPEGTLSGIMTMTINSLGAGTFGTAPYSGAVTMGFTGFSISTAGMSGTLDGSMTLSISASSVNVFTETLTAPSLRVASSFGGAPSHTITLSGFAAHRNGTLGVGGAPTVTFDFSGNMGSSALGSSVDLQTKTPFVQLQSEAYPHVGVLEATGTKNSKLVMTTLSNTQVQLDLDADGNGSFETTTTVPWSTLR